MKKSTIAVLVTVLVIVAGLFISKFNAFNTLQQQIDIDWNALEGTLAERYDSIPQLVADTTLYTGNELAIAKQLEAAHASFLGASSVAKKLEGANGTEAALQKLEQILAQQDPGIAGSHPFSAVQQTLNTTGITLGPLQQKFNQAIDRYNTYAGRFPNDLLGLIMGFPHDYPYYQPQGR